MPRSLVVDVVNIVERTAAPANHQGVRFPVATNGNFTVATNTWGRRVRGHIECLQTWRPFRASAGARSNGFWEVIARPDGINQWAYKGFALYTHTGDTAPGQNRWQGTYVFADLDGSSENLHRAATLADIGNAGGGAGVYWNIAKP